MERIEKQWNVFLKSNNDTSNTQEHLDKIQSYKTIHNENETAYAQWLNKYQKYQQILNETGEKKSSPETEYKNVQHLCSEYTQLQQQLDTEVESCSTENQLDHIIQLWKNLDNIHSQLILKIKNNPEK